PTRRPDPGRGQPAPPRAPGRRRRARGGVPLGRRGRHGRPGHRLPDLPHRRPPRAGGARLDGGLRRAGRPGHRHQRQDHDGPPPRRHGPGGRPRRRAHLDRPRPGGERSARTGRLLRPGRGPHPPARPAAPARPRGRRAALAVLAAARGGIRRRGLAVERATAALVTNIAADHLGEYGIHDLPSLAAAKLVVARAVPPSGRVILNADDPELARAPQSWPAPVSWFTLDPERQEIRDHLASGGEAALLDGETRVLAGRGRREAVAPRAGVPIAQGGAARYNVGNALAAIGLAAALGLPISAMAEGLARFASTPEDNPGRANLFDLG